MKPQDARGLAKAISCWLGYKAITGFEETLGEAMLAIPISEFLKSRTNWILESEIPYRQLCGSNGVPEFYCDFAGTPKYGQDYQFILETKFLKSKAQNVRRDLAADFIRLSIPPRKTLKRYFLLAGLSNLFAPEQSTMLFGKPLFDLSQGGGRSISPAEEIMKLEYKNSHPRLYNMIAQNQGCSVPSKAYVHCHANEWVSVSEDRTFRVLIWSVALSK